MIERVEEYPTVQKFSDAKYSHLFVNQKIM